MCLRRLGPNHSVVQILNGNWLVYHFRKSAVPSFEVPSSVTSRRILAIGAKGPVTGGIWRGRNGQRSLVQRWPNERSVARQVLQFDPVMSHRERDSQCPQNLVRVGVTRPFGGNVLRERRKGLDVVTPLLIWLLDAARVWVTSHAAPHQSSGPALQEVSPIPWGQPRGEMIAKGRTGDWLIRCGEVVVDKSIEAHESR